MWIILLLGILVLKGAQCTLTEVESLSEMSNSASCDNEGRAQSDCLSELRDVNLGFVWNENLDEACQAVQKYADCVDDDVKLCSGGRAVIIAKSQTGVMRDLCDKHSNLRKAYLRSSQCLDRLKHDKPYSQKCVASGGKMYDAYSKSTRIEVNVAGYERKPCFQSAYATACMIATIDRGCGKDAADLVTEIAQRLKLIEEACPEDYMEEIKNEFLKFLKKEAGQFGRRFPFG